MNKYEQQINGENIMSNINEATIQKNLKQCLNEQQINVDFHDAEFEWNEEADSFNDLNFTVYADEEYNITDFNAWLKENFPKEYEVLQILSNKELWGTGFEHYVINTMVHDGVTSIAGCYPEPNVPLIRFCDAKTITIK